MKKETKSSAFSVWIRALKLWWTTANKMFKNFMLMGVFQVVTPFIFLLIQARLVEEITGGKRPESLSYWVIMMVSLTALTNAFTSWFSRRYNQYNIGTWIVENNIFAGHFLDIPYSDLEQPELRKQYSKLSQMRNWAGMGLGQVWQSFTELFVTGLQSLLAFLMSFGIFTQARGAMTSEQWITSVPAGLLFVLLILVFSILSPIIYAMAQQKFFALSSNATAGNRVFSWLFQLADADRGMEVRIFHQNDYATRLVRKDKTFSAGGIMDRALRGPIGRYYMLSMLFSAIAMLLAYLYVGTLGWLGTITVGQVTQYIGAVTMLSSGIQSVVRALGMIFVQKEVLKMGYEIMDLAVAEEGENASAVPVSFEKSIEFRDVNFRYPGSERDALSDLNLTIRPHERLAIVGRNGSGKTTLVKLLCRLYQPDSGEILLDGKSVSEIDPAAWRDMLAVVFQDSRLFSFTLGENVESGYPKHTEEAQECLRKAGLDLDRARSLPQGLETYLYKHLDDSGVSVSGGEAQKIAIARALYKGGSLFILDEPTAALDPIAESEIYKQLNEIVRDKSAIFISHRLSSCRFSSRILVFDEGRVVEEGTHEDLLARGGLYSELWAAQAQYYTEEEQEKLGV